MPKSQNISLMYYRSAAARCSL